MSEKLKERQQKYDQVRVSLVIFCCKYPLPNFIFPFVETNFLIS